METSAFRPVCEECHAPIAVGSLQCESCGRVWVAADVVASARTRTDALLEATQGDPYLRSAGLLGYTLRSHVRGFLDDPSHPLARRILALLYAMALEAGPPALRQLAPLAEREWIAPTSPVLARATTYVRERFAPELERVATSHSDGENFERWVNALDRRG